MQEVPFSRTSVIPCSWDHESDVLSDPQIHREKSLQHLHFTTAPGQLWIRSNDHSKVTWIEKWTNDDLAFPKIGVFTPPNSQIIHFNRGFHYKPSILGYPLGVSKKMISEYRSFFWGEGLKNSTHIFTDSNERGNKKAHWRNWAPFCAQTNT